VVVIFDVTGIPGAQGSKKHVGNGVMVESSAKVRPWRQDVVAAALEELGRVLGRPAFMGPVGVDLTFRFTRPKSHYGTGRNAGVLKDSAPKFPTSRALGDADKLARSTLDALVTAGVLADDSLVVDLNVRKRYSDTPGARIQVLSATPLISEGPNA